MLISREKGLHQKSDMWSCVNSDKMEHILDNEMKVV